MVQLCGGGSNRSSSSEGRNALLCKTSQTATCLSAIRITLVTLQVVHLISAKVNNNKECMDFQKENRLRLHTHLAP